MNRHPTSFPGGVLSCRRTLELEWITKTFYCNKTIVLFTFEKDRVLSLKTGKLPVLSFVNFYGGTNRSCPTPGKGLTVP